MRTRAPIAGRLDEDVSAREIFSRSGRLSMVLWLFCCIFLLIPSHPFLSFSSLPLLLFFSFLLVYSLVLLLYLSRLLSFPCVCLSSTLSLRLSIYSNFYLSSCLHILMSCPYLCYRIQDGWNYHARFSISSLNFRRKSGSKSGSSGNKIKNSDERNIFIYFLNHVDFRLANSEKNSVRENPR